MLNLNSSPVTVTVTRLDSYPIYLNYRFYSEDDPVSILLGVFTPLNYKVTIDLVPILASFYDSSYYTTLESSNKIVYFTLTNPLDGTLLTETFKYTLNSNTFYSYPIFSTFSSQFPVAVSSNGNFDITIGSEEPEAYYTDYPSNFLVTPNGSSFILSNSDGNFTYTPVCSDAHFLFLDSEGFYRVYVPQHIKFSDTISETTLNKVRSSSYILRRNSPSLTFNTNFLSYDDSVLFFTHFLHSPRIVLYSSVYPNGVECSLSGSYSLLDPASENSVYTVTLNIGSNIIFY